MNMANMHYDGQEFEYQVDSNRRDEKEKESRSRRFQYARSNRPSVSHNGIHRRRNKRFSW